MTLALRQHERPAHFRNRWIVAAWIDEDPMGQRECEILHHETGECGGKFVRVRFTERRDLFEPETALYTPWQLLPAPLLPDEQIPCKPRSTSPHATAT